MTPDNEAMKGDEMPVIEHTDREREAYENGKRDRTRAIVAALEDFYHPQMGERAMHPADFITKRFELPGHENLTYA